MENGIQRAEVTKNIGGDREMQRRDEGGNMSLT